MSKPKKHITDDTPINAVANASGADLELEKKMPTADIAPMNDAPPELPIVKNTEKPPSAIDKINEFLARLSRISLSEKMFFIDNLRVMVKAGLSMSEALETLAMQAKNKYFVKVVTEIKNDVLAGGTLGDAVEKFPKIFPEFFVNMIKAGEMSGNLEKNLEELGMQMKKDHEIVSKVKGAMIYPAVIVAATVGITILMFVYVIPSVLSVFEDAKVQLPLSTRILIAVSNGFTHYGLYVGSGLIAFIAGLMFYFRTPKGKRVAHAIILNLFIIGPIAKKVNLARFSRTLSSLLKTDIPVIESLKITSHVVGNVHFKEVLTQSAEELTKGVQINSVLAKHPKLFPPIVTQMILVGEKSGNLDMLLDELAGFYEAEVEDITKNLASIIEPILIVFLGGVVALIAFAVISPIYTLSENI